MKKIIFSILMVLMPMFALADFIGFEAGGALWKTTNNDMVQVDGTKIDIQEDLGHETSKNTNFLWLSFEHPVPIIPNIKIVHSFLQTTGNKRVAKNIKFLDQEYIASSRVNSKLTLNQTDFIFYYEILDNIVELDLGFNIKYLNGEASLKSSYANKTKNLSYPIAMLYAKTKANLGVIPFMPNFSIGAEGSYFKISKFNVLDYNVALSYKKKIVMLDIGANMGYRVLDMLVDTDSTYIDLSTKGPYFGLFVHF